MDVFTVINPDIANDANVVDVRFSAHNSPFYKPERLDGVMGRNKDRVSLYLLDTERGLKFSFSFSPNKLFKSVPSRLKLKRFPHNILYLYVSFTSHPFLS